MKRWTGIVGESSIVYMRYTVEAETEEEAVAKMETGETVEEEFDADGGVTHRELCDGPEEAAA